MFESPYSTSINHSNNFATAYSSAQSMPIFEDNVKKYWEREISQFVLRPFFKSLSASKLRVLDLGSGYGQGFELLTHIPSNEINYQLQKDYLINENQLDLYLGLDNDYDWVCQANEIYQTRKRVRFLKADFKQGLGFLKGVEPAFDIYFSGDGSLSKLTKTELSGLITEVYQHAHAGSWLVLDLAGRFAADRPYERNTPKMQAWSREEILDLLHFMVEKKHLRLDVLKIFDRAILLGNNQEFNYPNSPFQNIREGINHLFTPYQRTDLNELIIQPEWLKLPDLPQVRNFFNYFIEIWNNFLKYSLLRLEKNISPEQIGDWEQFPASLQFGMLTLDRLIRDTGWIAYGDPRANLIEPHIAYVLRNLEFSLQQGLGCGQNMLVVLQIKK
jgi:SAM-dependent methyltransferase